MNDNELKSLFEASHPDLPDESGFQREVWKRIEQRSEFMSIPSLLSSLGELLFKPGIGLPIAAAAIVCSGLLAYHNGVQSREATWSELANNYNRIISPDNRHSTDQ